MSQACDKRGRLKPSFFVAVRGNRCDKTAGMKSDIYSSSVPIMGLT